MLGKSDELEPLDITVQAILSNGCPIGGFSFVVIGIATDSFFESSRETFFFEVALVISGLTAVVAVVVCVHNVTRRAHLVARQPVQWKTGHGRWCDESEATDNSRMKEIGEAWGAKELLIRK